MNGIRTNFLCDVKSRLQELFCRKNPLFSQWSPPTHAGGVIARYEAVGNVPAGNRRTTRERSLNLVATTGEGQGLDGTRSTQVNRRKHRYVRQAQVAGQGLNQKVSGLVGLLFYKVYADDNSRRCTDETLPHRTLIKRNTTTPYLRPSLHGWAG